MSKYTIIANGMGEFEVKEKTRTHTGVRWLTINNTVDICASLEDAQKKYPKAKVSDLGEQWFDKLASSQNQPSFHGDDE